jgi:CheY-like chemotaxis protein
VVEDDPALRSLAVRLLGEAGMTVLAAADARAALGELARGARPDLLFTDVVLPGGTNGAELAAQVARDQPGLPVLFTTGYPNLREVRTAVLPPDAEVLPKPYGRRALLEHVARLLGASDRS